MEIYHQSNKNCIGESFFVYHLRQHFPQATYINEPYPIEPDYLECLIDRQSVIAALLRDQKLPARAKTNCLNILGEIECPNNIKVALNAGQISCDVVITSDKGGFYWEFHEKQHRNLSVSRNANIYNADNNEAIVVPRYLQRLIRDIWRVQTFKNYTIVWQDWFVANCYDYQPQLQPGLKEFLLPNKFSFSEFYNHSEW